MALLLSCKSITVLVYKLLSLNVAVAFPVICLQTLKLLLCLIDSFFFVGLPFMPSVNLFVFIGICIFCVSSLIYDAYGVRN